jgi:hypothetical protein
MSPRQAKVRAARSSSCSDVVIKHRRGLDTCGRECRACRDHYVAKLQGVQIIDEPKNVWSTGRRLLRAGGLNR